MKNLVLFISILSVIFFSGCKKEESVSIRKITNTFSDSCVEVSLIYSEFYEGNSKKFKDLNDTIRTLLMKERKEFIKQAQAEVPELRMEGMETTYGLYITDSVFMANDKFFSVRYEYSVYTGGAHPNSGFAALNFDIENNKLLNDYDIIDTLQNKKINTLLEKYFVNPENCFEEKPSVALAETINVGQDSIVFTFPPYSLGAYVCGYVSVAVPRNELNNIVKL